MSLISAVNLPSDAAAVCNALADRDRWLSLRKDGLGASSSAAILGWSRYGSASSVYASYVERQRAPAPGADKARFTGWGHLQEPVIAGYYGQYSWQGRRRRVDRWVGPHNWMMRSRAHPFLYATPDYFVFADDRDGPGVLECKNMGLGNASHWKSWRREPPIWFWIQLQHQLLVTGWKWGSIAVLEDGNFFRSYDYDRDDRFCERLLWALWRFWDRIQRRDPPPADERKATKRALARTIEERGKTVMLPHASRRWHERRLELKRRLKDYEAECERLENEVRRAMGDATYGLIPGVPSHKFSLKETSREEHTVAACTYRKLLLVQHEKRARPKRAA